MVTQSLTQNQSWTGLLILSPPRPRLHQTLGCPLVGPLGQEDISYFLGLTVPFENPMKTRNVAQKTPRLKAPNLNLDKHISGPPPHWESVPQLGCFLGSQVWVPGAEQRP